MAHETVLILDFGSQYTQLIARRLRELGVFTRIERGDLPASAVREITPVAVVLSGGPASIYGEGVLRPDPEVLNLNVPVLGICYGMHAMAALLGGSVRGSDRREYGLAELEVVGNPHLFAGTQQRQPVWMSHGDSVEALPEGFEVIARTENTPVAAMADPARRFVALQFHPEVRHTPHGVTMLEAFLNLAGVARDWNPGAIRELLVDRLREQIGDGRVICGVSGGVDSSVTAVLLREAIGDRLVPIFVDTGLLRRDEGDMVAARFAGQGLE
jgi:GMP synthase (glutamine-hydrolysing)